MIATVTIPPGDPGSGPPPDAATTIDTPGRQPLYRARPGLPVERVRVRGGDGRLLGPRVSEGQRVVTDRIGQDEAQVVVDRLDLHADAVGAGALLEAAHPGRIDLGIGRAPGTDPVTSYALRHGAGGVTDEELQERSRALRNVTEKLDEQGAGVARRWFIF